ncbi:MAG: sugar transferase [Litoreibacter sp.]
MTIHYREISQKSDGVVEPSHFVAAPGNDSGFYRSFFKRALDFSATFIAAPFVALIVSLLALGVFAQDRRNPFYSQERVGKQGRIFTMWKLRSMNVNADAIFNQYLDENPEARKEWNEKQKLSFDPRITRFGAILRKTSLDELPQLLNVLTGDMSLVGPRPMMPEQRVLYTGTAYYNLRPGITGPWQVSERSTGTFAGRARFDEAYDRDLSLSQDLGLLGKTVGVVLRGTGQ